MSLGLESFSKEMQELETFFGKPLNPEQHRSWFEKLKHLSPRVFTSAVNEAILHERFFPTIGKILDYAAKQHDRAESDSKRNQPGYGFASPKPKDTEHQKQARALFLRVARGQLAGLDLAEAMFEMHQKYPMYGWHEAACEVMHRANLKLGIPTPAEYMPQDWRG